VIRAEARIEAIHEVLALPGGRFIAVEAIRALLDPPRFVVVDDIPTPLYSDFPALLHPTVTYEVTATWQTTPPDFPEPELGSPT
jgi:hypothetical protein